MRLRYHLCTLAPGTPYGNQAGLLSGFRASQGSGGRTRPAGGRNDVGGSSGNVQEAAQEDRVRVLAR